VSSVRTHKYMCCVFFGVRGGGVKGGGVGYAHVHFECTFVYVYMYMYVCVWCLLV
jgi:hypothetical protein